MKKDKTKEQSVPQAIRALKTIHWAVTLVPFLFGAIVLGLYYSGYSPESPGLRDMFLYSSVIVLAIALPLSTYVFTKFLRKESVVKSPSVSRILMAYQTAHLIRLSILEMAGLFAVLGAFVSGYMPILGITLLATLVMIRLSPTIEKMSGAFGIKIDG